MSRPRSYSWRKTNCIWCGHDTMQQYFPRRDRWKCKECGQPNWTDGRTWEENEEMTGKEKITKENIWGR